METAPGQPPLRLFEHLGGGGQKLKWKPAPRVGLLVVGLATPRGPPETRLCVQIVKTQGGCCDFDPKLFFLCKFCQASHPLFLLIKGQNTKNKERDTFSPPLNWCLGSEDQQGGAGPTGRGCPRQSLLSLRGTDTCTERHFHVCVKQCFCSKKFKLRQSASRCPLVMGQLPGWAAGRRVHARQLNVGGWGWEHPQHTTK